VRLMRMAFVAVIALIGTYTLVVGVRDGLLRQRISSRLHLDGRELRGTSALIHGAATTIVGIAYCRACRLVRPRDSLASDIMTNCLTCAWSCRPRRYWVETRLCPCAASAAAHTQR